MAKRAKPLAKSAYDFAHVKSVTAWVLVWEGAQAGKVVANWSDSPMGSVCTLTVSTWEGPLREWREKAVGCLGEYPGHMTGQAGGGGYCKFSSAFADALRREPTYAHEAPPKERPLAGCGKGEVKKYLQDLGYQVFEAI